MALLGFRGDGRQGCVWRLGIASGVLKAAGD
jgi:hypothetical protein